MVEVHCRVTKTKRTPGYASPDAGLVAGLAEAYTVKVKLSQVKSN